MKLLKIFGIVVGLHGAALVLIFANPGCNSTRSPNRGPYDATAAGGADAPVVSVPYIVADGGATAAGDPASTQVNAFGGGADAAGAVPLFASDTQGPVDAPVDAPGRARPTRPRSPVGVALSAAPVEDVTPVSTYTVVRGDSLWLIARRNNLTVSELAAANKLAPGAALQVGRKLVIPSKSNAAATAATSAPAKTAAPTTGTASPAAAKSSAPAEARTSLTHVVRAGETLGGIARRYKVRVGDIALANNISDPAKIRQGQSLVIPGGRVSTTVAAPRPTATAPTAAKAPPATTPSASQIESTPALSIDGEGATPVEAPPIDRPLDEGFGATSAPDDAPVIDIED
ncbi:hypothetical protein AXK11_06240 [Cephaloticoccus primus]|uniref:LysM domain-containing protein n=1 Tax=Cephaloticoccus primus TaxID=1548207 RepID=A0A139SLQ4_9BACT|nr:LysM peptidoglycan-binding domain-containing protein [Cephaloticoccus primus]KXU35478.1 hypothetical protein AXK11_06240 [Cephaloticoccus primus]